MKTAKQQAIEKIVSDYYDNYPIIKPFVQSDGYFPITNGYINNLNEHVKAFYKSLDGIDYLQSEDHEEYNSHFRPKDLTKLIADVKQNNGWIRIDSEDDLPKGSLDCMMIVSGFDDIKIGWFDTFLSKEKPSFLYKENKQIWEYKNVTHYKPITPELKPIW